MTRDVTLYLKDILDNMNKAVLFTENMVFDGFAEDVKTSYAVVRCIEIIGEASKNVPYEIRRKYPAIPWQKMAGMRDKISHFYFGINLKKVWLVVKEDIPRLKPLIEQVLSDVKS
ncbi:MAG: DUF86 domain-containing protein [Nitrospirae bacterium]|nr:MAG: DUF86 domain-containing protein [Nitrospirota bacterium]